MGKEWASGQKDAQKAQRGNSQKDKGAQGVENSQQQEASLTALAAKTEKAGTLRWLLPRRRLLRWHVCAIAPSGAISEDECGGSSQGFQEASSIHLANISGKLLSSCWVHTGVRPSGTCFPGGSVEAKEQFQVVGNAMKKKTGLEE